MYFCLFTPHILETFDKNINLDWFFLLLSFDSTSLVEWGMNAKKMSVHTQWWWWDIDRSSSEGATATTTKWNELIVEKKWNWIEAGRRCFYCWSLLLAGGWWWDNSSRLLVLNLLWSIDISWGILIGCLLFCVRRFAKTFNCDWRGDALSSAC